MGGEVRDPPNQILGNPRDPESLKKEAKRNKKKLTRSTKTTPHKKNCEKQFFPKLPSPPLAKSPPLQSPPPPRDTVTSMFF